MKAGKPGFGHIQGDGSYVLQTYRENDGAVVGEHLVTIYGESSNNASKSSADRSVSRSSTQIPAFSRITVPSGTFTVSADKDNRIDIALTSDDLRKYADRQD